MNYQELIAQVRALTDGVPHWVANFANASAAIWQAMDGINWAGFYILEDGILVLGPFQGKPACIEIPMGRGVCGTAAAEQKTQLVPDVHQFPGHIACSSASKSEIVVPIIKDNTVTAVLDIDSEHLATFDETDRQWLEKIVELL